MSLENKYKNKIVWLTGASTGIGEQLAYQLSALGAKLILSSRNEKLLETVAQKCESVSNVKILPLDLNNQESFKEKCQKALSLFGKIDYLFNISGVAHRDFALNTNMNVDRKLMQINYFGAIEITKLIMSDMIRQGGGQIVVASSLSGKYGVPLLTAYSASKHALHGFFDSLRAEIKKENIKITIVIPGFIKTHIIQNALTGDGSPYGKKLEIQDNGMPADVCAKKILIAVAKGKDEVIIGGAERFTVLFNRLFPHTFSKFISNHPMKKFIRLKSFLMPVKKQEQ